MQPPLKRRYTVKFSRPTKQSLPFVLSLLFIALMTYISVIYSQNNFSVDSDLNNLVQQQAPWKDNLNKTVAEFSESDNGLVIVVSGKNSIQVQSITAQLQQDFAKNPLFTDLFSAATLPWFKQQALWFMPDEEYQLFNQNLNHLLPRLKAAMVSAPELSAMQLLTQLEQSLDNEDRLSAKLLLKMLNQLATTDEDIDWYTLLMSETSGQSYQIITLNAKPQNDQKEPNKLIMESAQKIIANYADVTEVKIRITGQTALDFDEINDANSSVKLAGIMSLIGLIVVLGFGIRSLRIILASYAAVLIGLTWTLALGLFLVGSYNTISIVFLVMFIGLGVDFAIHFCLRIREEQALQPNNRASLLAAMRGTISPLSLCALTSAIGFLGFYPTAYTGLAELGIISSAGMLMGLLATFTVIPCFFFLFGYPTIKAQQGLQAVNDNNFWLPKHYKLVVCLALLTLLISGFGASEMDFDFSTLVLKSEKSESVQTLNEIQKQGLTSSYQMMMLATSVEQAQDWQSQLSALPVVSNVISINSFLPQNREQRMSDLTQTVNLPAAPILPLGTFSSLENKLVDLSSPEAKTSLSWLKSSEQGSVIEQITQRALLPLQQMQKNLGHLLQAPTPSIDDIPLTLAKRYQNENYLLVVAYPSGDMRDVTQLGEFIKLVQEVAPDATGRPVAEQQVGKIIINAFLQATSYSLLLIALILLFALQHKRDVILVFVPLLLTTLSTMAVAYWSGQALNMANIIVIPLIFGLGVDNGIHIVERFRSSGSARAFYQSSTPKAAILSSLTTMATFSSLLLADHRGMYSIGFLLTIAIGFLLFYSLTVLPALLFSVKKKTA